MDMWQKTNFLLNGMIFCELFILKFWKQANKSLGVQYFLVATVQTLPNL